MDAGLAEAVLGAVAREEVEIAVGQSPVADEGQDQRGLLLGRRLEGFINGVGGLGGGRVDEWIPGQCVGATPHLGVGHYRVQVHRRLGQERQGRQARAL